MLWAQLNRTQQEEGTIDCKYTLKTSILTQTTLPINQNPADSSPGVVQVGKGSLPFPRLPGPQGASACPGTGGWTLVLSPALPGLFPTAACYCCNHLIAASVDWSALGSAAVGKGDAGRMCASLTAAVAGEVLPSCTSPVGLGSKNGFIGRGRDRKPKFFFHSPSVFSSEKITSLLCSTLFHRLILYFD